MLIVPTYIAPSKIKKAGNGLFAAAPIACGAVVFKRHPLSYMVLSREEIARLPDLVQSFFRTYATLRDNGWNLTWDNGRFINHSEAPNLAYDHHGDVIAVRDVARNEELTENYVSLQEIEPFPEDGPF